MFRHHHHPDTVAERIDQLMAALMLPDEPTRLERLDSALSPLFVYISPTVVVDGAQGLSDAFSHYRHDEWLHITLERASGVDVHHGYLRYAWRRKEGDDVVMEGWTFGQLDEEGRITRLVSFDGLVPGEATERS